MKAIPATGKIDAQGQLSLDYPIEGTLPSSVRVIILFAESEADTTEFWQNISEYQQRNLNVSKTIRTGIKTSFD